MTPEELKNRFLIHGIKASVRRDEVRLQTCVFCGNTRWNLEANPALGLYHCWTCGKGGRVDELVREVTGITVHIPVTKVDLRDRPRTKIPAEIGGDPVVEHTYHADYLRVRGLTAVDMAVYQIRVFLDSVWENRVIFPQLEYWSRSVIGYVGRTIIPGGRPKYHAQWESDRRSVAGYRNRSPVHVLVEGPFDGIKVHKAGFNAAVLNGTSIPGLEFWAASVPPAHTVVVLLDGEARAEAHRLYSTVLPIHSKTVKIDLPEMFDPGNLEALAVQKIITHYLKEAPLCW